MSLLRRHKLVYRGREIWSVLHERWFRTDLGGFIQIIDDDDVNGYGRVSQNLTQEINCELGMSIVGVLCGKRQ